VISLARLRIGDRYSGPSGYRASGSVAVREMTATGRAPFTLE